MKTTTVLFILFTQLTTASLFTQEKHDTPGYIVICEGLDSNNDFVNENVKVLKKNTFVWYYMRYDIKYMPLTDFEIGVTDIASGIEKKTRCELLEATPCLYVEDKLDNGKWKIKLYIDGVLQGVSPEFEINAP